ncbi:hypothetical protein JOQ06_013102 [Pogonophryne albipinna]|uniref:Trinucleotide repeat-containing gene 6C protein n=1 Tax=Pogonophryne albipinna TaxID=1090488 RepID=A0AAD6BJ90_9TELE|nr:hypothetical protein JOQ06_013102 [Pogonophryne albipinna]
MGLSLLRVRREQRGEREKLKDISLQSGCIAQYETSHWGASLPVDSCSSANSWDKVNIDKSDTEAWPSINHSSDTSHTAAQECTLGSASSNTDNSAVTTTSSCRNLSMATGAAGQPAHYPSLKANNTMMTGHGSANTCGSRGWGADGKQDGMNGGRVAMPNNWGVPNFNMNLNPNANPSAWPVLGQEAGGGCGIGPNAVSNSPSLPPGINGNGNMGDGRLGGAENGGGGWGGLISSNEHDQQHPSTNTNMSYKMEPSNLNTDGPNHTKQQQQQAQEPMSPIHGLTGWGGQSPTESSQLNGDTTGSSVWGSGETKAADCPKESGWDSTPSGGHSAWGRQGKEPPLSSWGQQPRPAPESEGSRDSTESQTDHRDRTSSTDCTPLLPRQDLDPRVLSNTGWGQTPIRQHTVWEMEEANSDDEKRKGCSDAMAVSKSTGGPSSNTGGTINPQISPSQRSGSGEKSDSEGLSSSGWRANPPQPTQTGSGWGDQPQSHSKAPNGTSGPSGWGEPLPTNVPRNGGKSSWGSEDKSPSWNNGMTKSQPNTNPGWEEGPKSSHGWGNSNGGPNNSSTGDWGQAEVKKNGSSSSMKMEIDDGTSTWGNPAPNSGNPAPNSGNPAPNSGNPAPNSGKAVNMRDRNKPNNNPGNSGPPPSWGEVPSVQPKSEPAWGEPAAPTSSVDNGTSAWGKSTGGAGGWGDGGHEPSGPYGRANGPTGSAPCKPGPKPMQESWGNGGEEMGMSSGQWDTEEGDMWNSPTSQESSSSCNSWGNGPKKGPSKAKIGKPDEAWIMNRLIKQLTDMGFPRDPAEEALKSNNMNLDQAMSALLEKKTDLDKRGMGMSDYSNGMNKPMVCRPSALSKDPSDRNSYLDKDGILSDEAPQSPFLPSPSMKLPLANSSLPGQGLGQGNPGLAMQNLNNRQAYQRLQIQQQMMQAQRNVSGPIRQQEQQVARQHQSPGLSDSMHTKEALSSPNAYSSYPLSGLNPNMNVNCMEVGGLSLKEPPQPQSRLSQWTHSNSMDSLSGNSSNMENLNKHGAISAASSLGPPWEAPPYGGLIHSESPTSPQDSWGPGKSQNEKISNGTNINWPPEFCPGVPWKGLQNIDPENDPNMTPGSVPSGPTINTNIHDVNRYLLRDRNGATSPAPSLENGSLPPPSSDWPFSGYNSSFSLSSSDGDSSGKMSDMKSTWSQGPISQSQASLSHELWKVPQGPRSNPAPSRPPPGLSHNKPSSTWGGNSLGLAQGWSNSYTSETTTWSTDSSNRTSSWLVLRNLTPQIDGSTLRTLCMQHGPLITFHLNLTQGNAVVRYSSKDEAAKAQKSLHMCVLGNTTILAEFAGEEEVNRFFAQGQSLGANTTSWQANPGANQNRMGGGGQSHSMSQWSSGGKPSGGDLLWGNVPQYSSLWGPPSGEDHRGIGSPTSINTLLPGDLLSGESM